MGWLKDDAYTWRGMCSVCKRITEFRHGRCNADNPSLDSLNPREPDFNPNYVRHQPVNQEKNTLTPSPEKKDVKKVYGLPLFPTKDQSLKEIPQDESKSFLSLPLFKRRDRIEPFRFWCDNCRSHRSTIPNSKNQLKCPVCKEVYEQNDVITRPQ